MREWGLTDVVDRGRQERLFCRCHHIHPRTAAHTLACPVHIYTGIIFNRNHNLSTSAPIIILIQYYIISYIHLRHQNWFTFSAFSLIESVHRLSWVTEKTLRARETNRHTVTHARVQLLFAARDTVIYFVWTADKRPRREKEERKRAGRVWLCIRLRVFYPLRKIHIT